MSLQVCVLPVILIASISLLFPVALGFSVQSPCLRSFRSSTASSILPSTTRLYLVTEDDVLQAVTKAEVLWAEALEARKTANALSDRAEEEAEAAAQISKEVATLYKTMKSISLEKVAKADTAAQCNLGANKMVGRALDALKTAEELEEQAEQALVFSEDQLKQHLQDFPESSLA